MKDGEYIRYPLRRRKDFRIVDTLSRLMLIIKMHAHELEMLSSMKRIPAMS